MSAKSSIGALEQAIKILEIVVFEGGNGITIKEISQKIELHPLHYISIFKHFFKLRLCFSSF